MKQELSVKIPVTFNYWDLVKNMSNEAKRNLVALLQKSLNSSESKSSEESMSFSEAKSYLGRHKLPCHNVPADFNGMRDEVNQKYL